MNIPAIPSSLLLSVPVPDIDLLDGQKLPSVGFGCYQAKNAFKSVSAALRVGYRYIDTARVYKNEEIVGKTIEAASSSGIARSDIYVTTKVNARSIR